MSKKLLAFLIEELDTVRLLCRTLGCAGAVEFSVVNLESLRELKCPACGATLCIPRAKLEDNSLMMLGAAIRNLKAVTDKLGVEFIIPEKSQS
jgi:hypothetical protein